MLNWNKIGLHTIICLKTNCKIPLELYAVCIASVFFCIFEYLCVRCFFFIDVLVCLFACYFFLSRCAHIHFIYMYVINECVCVWERGRNWFHWDIFNRSNPFKCSSNLLLPNANSIRKNLFLLYFTLSQTTCIYRSTTSLYLSVH